MVFSTHMPGIVYKKWLAVMLAFMALFLTSCGEKEAERGKLMMVTNATFPPYEFYPAPPSNMLSALRRET